MEKLNNNETSAILHAITLLNINISQNKRNEQTLQYENDVTILVKLYNRGIGKC